MEDGERSRLGVVGAVVADGRVLLVKQAYANRYGRGKGYWWVPGGYVRSGETLAAAVVRELREETGLLTEPEGILGVRTRPEDVVVAFRMKVTGGRLQPDGREVVDARFFTLAELAAEEHVMGLSRRLAEAALREEHGLLVADGFRPPGRRPDEYVLYL